MVGEACVIQAQQVKEGCVEIVDVDAISRHLNAVLVAAAVDMPAFYSTAGKHAGENVLEMIAAGMIGSSFIGSAAKLGGNDHQSILKHSSLFQITQ